MSHAINVIWKAHRVNEPADLKYKGKNAEKELKELISRMAQNVENDKTLDSYTVLVDRGEMRQRVDVKKYGGVYWSSPWKLNRKALVKEE